MSILTLRGINMSFGAAPVLAHVDLRIEAGERVCLVGRNGEGKSTLLKLIAGELVADEGLMEQRQGLRIAALAQQLPGDFPGSVYELVAGGVGEVGDLLARYHQLSQGPWRAATAGARGSVWIPCCHACSYPGRPSSGNCQAACNGA